MNGVCINQQEPWGSQSAFKMETARIWETMENTANCYMVLSPINMANILVPATEHCYFAAS
jgi:hypothetical protein